MIPNSTQEMISPSMQEMIPPSTQETILLPHNVMWNRVLPFSTLVVTHECYRQLSSVGRPSTESDTMDLAPLSSPLLRHVWGQMSQVSIHMVGAALQQPSSQWLWAWTILNDTGHYGSQAWKWGWVVHWLFWWVIRLKARISSSLCRWIWTYHSVFLL